jgi:hypothetical protein
MEKWQESKSEIVIFGEEREEDCGRKRRTAAEKERVAAGSCELAGLCELAGSCELAMNCGRKLREKGVAEVQWQECCEKKVSGCGAWQESDEKCLGK